MPLGFPFDLASYGLLLLFLSAEVNMVPGELLCTLGDTHIYKNQLKPMHKQVKREPRPFPKLEFKRRENIEDYVWEDINLIDYNPHPSIKYELSN